MNANVSLLRRACCHGDPEAWHAALHLLRLFMDHHVPTLQFCARLIGAPTLDLSTRPEVPSLFVHQLHVACTEGDVFHALAALYAYMLFDAALFARVMMYGEPDALQHAFLRDLHPAMHNFLCGTHVPDGSDLPTPTDRTTTVFAHHVTTRLFATL